MADNLYLKGDEEEMKAVSSAPSMNKTPVGSAEPPLPYPVVATLSDAINCSPNVFFNGKPAYLLNRSSITKCKGDSPGSKKGLKKGTVNGEARATQASSTTLINGEPPVRIGDTCTIQGGEAIGRFCMAPRPAPMKSEPGGELPSFGPPTEENAGQDAMRRLEEIKAQDERERWRPMEAMARKQAELKETLTKYQPGLGQPEMTDATRPRRLSMDEQETAQIREVLGNYIAKQQMIDCWLGIVLGPAAAMQAPWTFRGLSPEMRRGAPLEPISRPPIQGPKDSILPSEPVQKSKTGPKLEPEPPKGKNTGPGDGGTIGPRSLIKPKVRAVAFVNGEFFKDVNQEARQSPNANEKTLISERVAAKEAKLGTSLPNGNMATAHAEIGVMQQAYNAGVTHGADMTIVVTGREVCGFCNGDIPAMAKSCGLKSLKIIERKSGKTLLWKPGVKTLKKGEK